MRVTRRTCVSLFLAFLMSSAALAQGAGDFLPPSFSGWNGTAAVCDCRDETMAVLREYGMTRREDVLYKRGSEVLTAVLLHFKDPSGAYGAYSYLHTPDMLRTDLAEHSLISNEHGLILTGNLVLEVRSKELLTHASDLKALLATVERHAQKGGLPTLWQHLPQKSLVPRSDRYILGPLALNQLLPLAQGDWLGFSKGAEAEIANYKINGHDAILLIADFPTPQLAAQELQDLQKQLDVNGSRPGTNAPPLFAKRSLTLLAIISGARSQAEADTLLDQVHYGTELTWNEPTFQFKEPTIGVMVVGTIIGTFIICGFTLIAGLAFGGFRVLTKRFLPNKVFDRGSQLQVLQLGLSSKPINAEDFYASAGEPVPTGQVDKNLPDRIALRIFR